MAPPPPAADIYISLVSYTHQVAAKGWFVAMVSTTVETDNPEAEIKPGLELLGPIKQKYGARPQSAPGGAGRAGGGARRVRESNGGWSVSVVMEQLTLVGPPGVFMRIHVTTCTMQCIHLCAVRVTWGYS